jgi:hypothetical protein
LPMPRGRRQSVPAASANTFAPLAFLPPNWHPQFGPAPMPMPMQMQAFPPLNPLLRPPQPVQWPAPSRHPLVSTPVQSVPAPANAGAGGTEGKRGADKSPQTTPSKPSRTAVTKKMKAAPPARVVGVCSDPEENEQSWEDSPPDSIDAEYTRRTGRQVLCLHMLGVVYLLVPDVHWDCRFSRLQGRALLPGGSRV